jgi:hypothetical protein
MKAMEQKNTHYTALKEQFKGYVAMHADKDTSLLFNQFVTMKVNSLLEGPDNIEKLNQQIKKSNEPIAHQPNSFKVDPDLYKKIEQSKKKHEALFDFVRKYQDTHSADPCMLADLKQIEDFTKPIKGTFGIYHNDKAMTADEFLALDDVDPAKKEGFRIRIFEQTKAQAVRSTLEHLPSKQAIEELPAAIQTFKTLQNHYTQFIHKYPDDEQRSEFEAKLAASKKLFATFPPEYLKDHPSKKEIERLSVASFLRKIGYRNIKDRLNNLLNGEISEEQRIKGFIEIGIMGEALKTYTEQYPTLEPEYAALLHKAANGLFEIFATDE